MTGVDLIAAERNPKDFPIPGDVFRKRNVHYTVHEPENCCVHLRRPLGRNGIRVEYFSLMDFQKWAVKAEIVHAAEIDRLQRKEKENA